MSDESERAREYRDKTLALWRLRIAGVDAAAPEVATLREETTALLAALPERERSRAVAWGETIRSDLMDVIELHAWRGQKR